LIDARPFVERFDQIQEVANELTVFLTCHAVALFLNVSIEEESQVLIGWVCIGFASFNIWFNLVMVGKQTSK